ncbi:MAG: heme lyase CcmF/NrfE family subunit [Arenicellales bacterium]
MIPEIGHFALSLALIVALMKAILPTIGIKQGYASWISLARPAAITQFWLVALAFACLTYAFVTNDYSVKLAAQHSNSKLPLLFKVSGVWGSHEGSLLLWALLLNLWTLAVALFSKSMPKQIQAQVLAVMAMISAGFLMFMLFTSNPFERLFPAPFEGQDLNPLLQDFGLAIHPPMLYMGYVGFSVAFAFAIAAMIGGRLDASWARWSRPWTNIAWAFLTIGIALGSWWAYYELGWGGWWFWDPVENASFMPWLVGTALMHSLAATEKRGVFKAWTVLLAVFAFSLSLLGTFLVRSGVLTSVHSFAADPGRGLFILIFLVVVIGGSLLLYAWRAPQIRSHVHFEAVSRETGLLLNNVLFMVAACSVLLGTLYPLILDSLGYGKISVGPPYFDNVFVPLTIPIALFMGIGAYARWKKDSIARIAPKLLIPFILSLTIGFAAPTLLDHYSVNAALGIALGAWVILSSLSLIYDRLKQSTGFKAVSSAPKGFYGMVFAHLGLGVFVIGVTLTSAYSIEKDIRMNAGESFEVSGYTFTFNGVKQAQGPNYVAQEGDISVHKNGKLVAQLDPQKRSYQSGMPMTEASIDAGLMRDLYVALGEPIGTDGAWAVRIYHKPLIRWIWLGCLIMGFGGVLAALDPRYRKLAVKDAKKHQSTLANASTADSKTAVV